MIWGEWDLLGEVRFGLVSDFLLYKFFEQREKKILYYKQKKIKYCIFRALHLFQEVIHLIQEHDHEETEEIRRIRLPRTVLQDRSDPMMYIPYRRTIHPKVIMSYSLSFFFF